MSVSYTHLDVYKRQEQATTNMYITYTTPNTNLIQPNTYISPTRS